MSNLDPVAGFEFRATSTLDGFELAGAIPVELVETSNPEASEEPPEAPASSKPSSVDVARNSNPATGSRLDI
jgi:hypothetical protein